MLARCEELLRETGGYFDVRADASGRLDPSGLVKGWAVDRAAAILEAAGARNYAVNAGGDIRLRGGALPERCWRVGIQHPLERDRIAAVVEARDLAIATSGAYERGEHVLDPHTGGRPAESSRSRSPGPTSRPPTHTPRPRSRWARARRNGRRRLDGYEAMTIFADGRVLLTHGFPLCT